MCFDGLFVIIKTRRDLDHVASTMTSFPIGASYHIVRGFSIHFGSDGQIRLDLSYTLSYVKLL
jgi:hypothetical protein